MAELLATLEVAAGAAPSRIEVWAGDISEMRATGPYDYLVVSAFPSDYAPTSRSLVGALSRSGVSLRALARNKVQDLRTTHACWVSRPTRKLTELGYGCLICFEPLVRGTPPEVVGDVFGALNTIVLGDHRDVTVAMPLVASGDQGWGREAMMTPLVEAATHWMKLGLPLKRLAIAERNPRKAHLLAETLRTHSQPPEPAAPAADPEGPADTSDTSDRPTPVPGDRGPADTADGYDAFISYAHRDAEHVDRLIRLLNERHPDLQLFVGRDALRAGSDWLGRIAEALDKCRKVIAFYSPEYFASRPCKSELETAVVREYRTGEDILLPVYLLSSDVPTFYLARQYVECREADPIRLEAAVAEIVGALIP